MESARQSVLTAFGVLPAMVDKSAQGPMVREGQRHLAQWTLQPIAAQLAEEAGRKLGSEITIDVMRPMQAYDVGGRARAVSALVDAMARAEEAKIDVNKALKFADWV